MRRFSAVAGFPDTRAPSKSVEQKVEGYIADRKQLPEQDMIEDRCSRRKDNVWLEGRKLNGPSDAFCAT